MNADLKRRLLIFGGGLMVGGVLSLGLFRYVSENREPAPVDTIKIAVSICDVKAGEPLTESCAEMRAIDSKFTPPDVLLMKRIPLYVDKKLKVDVPVGHAFRQVDFE